MKQMNNGNVIKRINDTTIEKYTSGSRVNSQFDFESYQKLYEQTDFLVKIKTFEKISNESLRFEIEYIDGEVLADFYKSPLISNKTKLLHYSQTLEWYMSMLEFSKKEKKLDVEEGRYIKQIFFHNDFNLSNIIMTKNNKLVLLDPESFLWMNRAMFLLTIQSNSSDFIGEIY